MVTFFAKQANFMKFLLTHACARPWYVYAETFIPSFLVLMLTVVLFDVDDAIRAHGESIVGGSKSKRKGRKRHTFKTRITAQQTTVARWSSKGLKTLLVITSPLEKIGFAWLLFAAVDQFFQNWQTLLQRSEYCNTPLETGPLQRSRGPGLISFVVGGVSVIMDKLEQNRAGWSTGPLGASLPRGEFFAVFALTVKGPPSGVNPVWIQLTTQSAFGVTNHRSDDLSLGPGEQGVMVTTASFSYLTAGGSIGWEIGGSSIPIGIEAVSAHLTVQRRG